MQIDRLNDMVTLAEVVKLCRLFGCRSGWKLEADSIATFSVDSKSGRELRPYLSSVTDKCEQNAADLPKVIIIDGLHHISSPLSDAFNGFLSVDCKSRWLSSLRIFCIIITRCQSNLTKSASRGAHSPVRGHPRGSKVVPLNSWGRVSY